MYCSAAGLGGVALFRPSWWTSRALWWLSGGNNRVVRYVSYSLRPSPSVEPVSLHAKAVRTAYDLLVAGKIPTKKLISGTFPLTQLSQAFDLLQRGEGIKYALIP